MQQQTQQTVPFQRSTPPGLNNHTVHHGPDPPHPAGPPFTPPVFRLVSPAACGIAPFFTAFVTRSSDRRGSREVYLTYSLAIHRLAVDRPEGSFQSNACKILFMIYANTFMLCRFLVGSSCIMRRLLKRLRYGQMFGIFYSDRISLMTHIFFLVWIRCLFSYG